MKPLLLGFILFVCQCATAQDISGVVNRYYKIAAINSDSGWAKLSDLDANLLTYHKALIIQVKGAAANLSPNDASFGDLDSIANAGHFEIANLCGFINDTVFFERKLNNRYTNGEAMQLVAIPEFSNITVTDTLKAQPWNSTSGTGGVIALSVTDTLFINKPITVTGAGFGGGALETFPDCTFIFSAVTDYYMPFSTSTSTNRQGARKGEGISDFVTGRDCGRGKQVTGGGGGNNHNGGGGGGSNYGAGGLGGSRTSGSGNCRSVSGKGVGGLALSAVYDSSTTRLFMGGGGGSGHGNQNGSFGNTAKPGGNGGGIIFIEARVIISNGGAIHANGAQPFSTNTSSYGNLLDADSDGGGGGGAGGAVLLLCNNYSGTLPVTATGAKGSNAGIGLSANFCDAPGGGGGGGLIKLSTVSTPASIVTTIAGGATGLVVNYNSPACYNTGNGATDGAAGAVKHSYVLPALRDSTPLCKQVLPVSLLLDFRGRLVNDKVLLTATVSGEQVEQVIFQRSFDGRHFTAFDEQVGGRSTYQSIDDFLHRVVYYSVNVKGINNSVYASQVVRFSSGSSLASNLDIFPNPVVRNELNYRLSIHAAEFLQCQILDASGKVLFTKSTFVNPGMNAYRVALPSLVKGIYYAKFTGATIAVVKQFIQMN